MKTIKHVKEVCRLQGLSIWKCLCSEEEVFAGNHFFYTSNGREVFDSLNEAIAGFHALYNFD